MDERDHAAHALDGKESMGGQESTFTSSALQVNQERTAARVEIPERLPGSKPFPEVISMTSTNIPTVRRILRQRE